MSVISMGVFSEVAAGAIKDSAQQVRVNLRVKVTLAIYYTVASILMQKGYVQTKVTYIDSRNSCSYL